MVYKIHHHSISTSVISFLWITLQLSYQIVDSLIWLGIRDMINDVRKKKLKLRPVTYLSGSQGSEANIPHGYIWSPHLVPKPKGFTFLLSFCLKKIVCAKWMWIYFYRLNMMPISSLVLKFLREFGGMFHPYLVQFSVDNANWVS